MDLKQLQYFVVCAQTGSFSDAAKVLYSTQPSVSKVVKALEDALGMQLFERLPRGIRLTVQGQKVYRYACRITNEIDALENMASHGMTKWIRVSLNPSSWFANQFVDFYNETYEKNYHFQLTTAGVRSVMDRVRDYVDGVRFIQNYQDEFFDIGSVHEESFQWKDIDISVLTNSDYIMEKMLKNSRISNVSGSYLSENKTGTTPGIPLDMGDSKVLFGYIVHKGEKIDESVQELIDFLVARLHKS